MSKLNGEREMRNKPQSTAPSAYLQRISDTTPGNEDARIDEQRAVGHGIDARRRVDDLVAWTKHDRRGFGRPAIEARDQLTSFEGKRIADAHGDRRSMRTLL